MLFDLTLSKLPKRDIKAGDAVDNARLLATGHIGTHLDTYRHSPIPLEYFKSAGILFDGRGIDEIGVGDIDLAAVREGMFVLFYTGWLDKHGYGTKEYAAEHPQLSDELIQALCDKKVRFIGIDGPGIRRHQQHRPADELCEDHGVYVIENLAQLAPLHDEAMVDVAGGFIVYTMWLDDPEASGLRCRVIAETE